MKNGYALPEHPAALAALAARLREDPDLAARAEGALRVRAAPRAPAPRGPPRATHPTHRAPPTVHTQHNTARAAS